MPIPIPTAVRSSRIPLAAALAATLAAALGAACGARVAEPIVQVR